MRSPRRPRRIDAQTDVDTTIAPKAMKDGGVQSDAPSTPSPTSLPYPTVTPNPTRWIRGCNPGRPLAEASIEQDPGVLSESADKTTQKKLVTSMANMMNEWEVDMMNEWEVEVSKLRGFRAEVEGGAHCDTFTKTQLGRDAIAEALIKQYPDVLKAPPDVQKQLASSSRGRDAMRRRADQAVSRRSSRPRTTERRVALGPRFTPSPFPPPISLSRRGPGGGGLGRGWYAGPGMDTATRRAAARISRGFGIGRAGLKRHPNFPSGRLLRVKFKSSQLVVKSIARGSWFREAR